MDNQQNKMPDLEHEGLEMHDLNEGSAKNVNEGCDPGMLNEGIIPSSVIKEKTQKVKRHSAPSPGKAKRLSAMLPELRDKDRDDRQDISTMDNQQNKIPDLKQEGLEMHKLNKGSAKNVNEGCNHGMLNEGNIPSGVNKEKNQKVKRHSAPSPGKAKRLSAMLPEPSDNDGDDRKDVSTDSGICFLQINNSSTTNPNCQTVGQAESPVNIGVKRKYEVEIPVEEKYFLASERERLPNTDHDNSTEGIKRHKEGRHDIQIKAEKSYFLADYGLKLTGRQNSIRKPTHRISNSSMRKSVRGAPYGSKQHHTSPNRLKQHQTSPKRYDVVDDDYWRKDLETSVEANSIRSPTLGQSSLEQEVSHRQFYRSRKTRSPERKGVGLGIIILAIIMTCLTALAIVSAWEYLKGIYSRTNNSIGHYDIVI